MTSSPASQADAQIQERLQAKQYREAFGMLLPHYRDRVFRLTFSMLRDRALAEDTTQDIFLRVWRALPGFAGQSQLSTWIYAISKNACLSELRKRRPQVSLDTDEDEQSAEVRGLATEDADDSATVSVGQLLDQLPERYRQAVVLFYMEDKSYEQTAPSLGLAARHGQSLAPSRAQAPNRADERSRMTHAARHPVERSPPGLAGRRSRRSRHCCVAGSHVPIAPNVAHVPMSCRRSIATCAAQPRDWRWTIRSTRRSSRSSTRSTIRSAPKHAVVIEQELQQNLHALARGWRRALLFVVPGVVAGVALAFALAWWLDTRWRDAYADRAERGRIRHG